MDDGTGATGTDTDLEAQAAELERLLPLLMRRLFTLEPDHPATDLSLAQLRVCMILQAGPRTLSELGIELGISVSAVTQVADRLEHAGLVERVPGYTDRRTRLVRLTDSGESVMSSRRETRTERVTRALMLLPKQVREDLMAHLHELLEAATLSAPPPAHEDPLTVRQDM